MPVAGALLESDALPPLVTQRSFVSSQTPPGPHFLDNTNSVFANTNLNSPFVGVETIQDNFGFTNQVTEFDQELENEIL